MFRMYREFLCHPMPIKYCNVIVVCLFKDLVSASIASSPSRFASRCDNRVTRAKVHVIPYLDKLLPYASWMTYPVSLLVGEV